LQLRLTAQAWPLTFVGDADAANSPEPPSKRDRKSTVSSFEDEPGLALRIKVMRIILLALMASVGLFLLIAVWLRNQGVVPVAPVPIVTYVGFAFAAGLLAAIRYVPNRIVAATRRNLAMIPADLTRRAGHAGLSPDVGVLLAAYQTRLIIVAALIEGIAYYFLVAYLLDGLWISLVMAGVCLAVLATQFPTEDGVQRWLERQRELLLYDRSQR
jgi:hypothetical protein